MRCLPTLNLAGQPVRLPLCDSAAEKLVCAMLAECDATSRESLTTALACDPALTLWCVLNSSTSDLSADAMLPSIDTLADWLTAALPDVLNVDASVNTESPNTVEQEGDAHEIEFDAEQLLEHATAAVQLANHMATAATSDQTNVSVTAQPEYTRGLLFNTAAWVSEEQRETVAKQFDLLPEETPNDDAAPATLMLTQESQLSDYWLNACEVANHVFPLAAKLEHTVAIESQFADTLQQEKMQALYTLAAGAGHEINNPLGSIAGRAQLLVRDETDAQRRRTLAKINTQAFRAHEMISDMMLFARPPAPKPTEVDVASLIAEVLEQLREEAAERSTVLSFTPPSDPLHISADRTQLAVALRAMCTNSLEAISDGGHIEVTTRLVEAPEQDATVEIEVRDNGPGIPPDLHSQLFDPFYSGREAGRGLGFGLSKCWRIVTQHGGDIRVNSEPGRGATFTITLPTKLETIETT